MAALLGATRPSDLNTPVLPAFPDYHTQVTDRQWSLVTVRHLLTMTCGLRSELTDPDFDDAWFTSADPVGFALAQPLEEAPGRSFRYSNAGAHLLGEWLARKEGVPLDALLQSRLLDPVGARLGGWDRDATGRCFGSGSARLTSRGLARFGQLILRRGRAHRQVVPEAWVLAMTSRQTPGDEWMEGIPDSGYLWWVSDEVIGGAWCAAGFGGQYVAVFPETQRVIVVTGVVQPHASHRAVIAGTLLPAFVPST